MSKPLKVFITYSHKNTKAKDQLITRLRLLKREGIIDIWHDNEILPGDKWRDAIFNNLADSDLLLYLVSANSLDSENCNKELAKALKEDIKVIPIILEHCDWLYHKLSGFQALPDKGKPLTKWNDESEGWQDVIDGIRKTVNKMKSKTETLSDISESEILAELVCQRGNVLLLLGKTGEAIEIYSQAIELNPHHAFAYNNRGIAYDRNHEVNKALEDYGEAIQLKNDYVEAYYNRGTVYGENGKIDLAIKDYGKAIKLDPRLARAYSHRGNAYQEKNEIDQAIKDHNKAIALDQNDPIFYNNRGITYGEKGDLDLAIKDFNKAIELKQDYAKAYNNRGAVYRSKGKLDKSIEDCSKAIQLDPDYIDPYNNRGAAYRNKGEVDLAIEDYNRAIQLNPDFFKAYYNRGIAYHEKCEYDLAIKDYSKATELRPKHAHPYNNRGNIYLLKGNFDSAIKDYNKAIELNSKLPIAYYNRGTAYSKKGELDKAIQNYTQAIQLNPDVAEAYYYRGEAWLHLQGWDKAKVDLTTAKRMDMDVIAAFHNSYKNVETYEKRHHVKLPKDIALLLTQRRRTRYPKTQKVLDADGNPLESPNVVNLRQQLRNVGMPLGKYLKAKPAFGINTTPTETFVVDKATRDKLIAAHPPSADILKPFLHGEDLRRWHVDTPHQWLIFAHRGIAINDYPAILKHLEKYRESLSKRKGRQEWYELPVSLGDTERFAQQKLVCPNTYNHQTFAVDTSGYYYGNTSYLIPTDETWLCGLLNSRTVEWFYSQVSNQLTIDYLRARSGYIQQIPIPDLTSTQKTLIAKLVDYLIYLQQQPTINSKDLKYARDRIMLGYFERVIDGLVYEAYLPEDLHKGDKHFSQPLLDEQLPSYEEIEGDKMTVLRDIFELLYERTHLVRRNLYYLDSVKAVRIIEGKI